MFGGIVRPPNLLHLLLLLLLLFSFLTFLHFLISHSKPLTPFSFIFIILPFIIIIIIFFLPFFIFLFSIQSPLTLISFLFSLFFSLSPSLILYTHYNHDMATPHITIDSATIGDLTLLAATTLLRPLFYLFFPCFLSFFRPLSPHNPQQSETSNLPKSFASSRVHKTLEGDNHRIANTTWPTPS